MSDIIVPTEDGYDIVIPRPVYEAALDSVEREDRPVVIGYDAYFGWMYVDPDDARVGNLGDSVLLENTDGDMRPLGLYISSNGEG